MIARVRYWLWAAAQSKNFPLISTLVITALGAIVRFGNLANPHLLVFDETYYVKDAYTLGLFGSERNWPEDPNPRFEAGDTEIYLDQGAYVVHPPIGKWLIWIGIQLFGVDSAFGWRFSTALLGTLSIPLLILVARKLIGNNFFAAGVGLALALEGQSIVMSRTALLDGVLAFLLLLGFYLIVLDDLWWRRRLTEHAQVLGFRPWLLLSAVVFGMAVGTKWSALYFVAAFGLYTFASDWISRSRLGQRPAWSVVQGAINAVTLLVPLFAVYLLGWLGWILGDDGWGRQAGGNWFSALWEYHRNAYSFHIGLSSEHPYQSNALEWLVLARPTAFFFENYENNPSCGLLQNCSVAITALPHPLLWFASLFAMIWLILRSIRRLDRAGLLISLGFLAGWLPWVFYLGRTTFQFYTVILVPFMLLALGYGLHRYWRMGIVSGRNVQRERTLIWFLIATVVLAGFFLSLWTGIPTPNWLWRSQMWLPIWI